MSDSGGTVGRKHPSRRSPIAGANALFRAHEATLPLDQRIVFDPYAARFVDKEFRRELLRISRWFLPPLNRALHRLQTVHCIRHRSVDALLTDAVAAGYRQVVIVGAGYDMRAFRMRELPSDVRWYEVDHPHTAEEKRARLVGLPERDPVQRVPADLEERAIEDVLAATDLNPELPVVYIVEGLIHYLSMDRLNRLLSGLAKGRGRRRLVVTFIRTEVYDAAPAVLRRIISWVNEIPRLHFTTAALRSLLATYGFERFESLTLEEQIARYCPQARTRQLGVSQDVAWAERP